MIKWLHNIPIPKQVLLNKLPERKISHDPAIDHKLVRLAAIESRIDPKIALLVHLYIIKLLNRVNYTDTVLAVRLLEALYAMPPLQIAYGTYPDVAFTDTVNSIYLNHFLFTKEFENAKAHFKRVPSLSHLFLVVIHEMGHILVGPTEEAADEFVSFFLEDIVDDLEYTLSKPFKPNSGFSKTKYYTNKKCETCLYLLVSTYLS